VFALIVRRATAADMSAVYRLTHDCYVASHYIEPRPDGMLNHHPHLDGIPQTTVLVADLDGEIVGTNSWTLDGPAGMHTDADFKAECDAVRTEGRVLAASWRIMVRMDCHQKTRIVLELIKTTVCDMVSAGVQVALFTFDEKHERFYRRFLNMRTIARRDESHGLEKVRPILMRLDEADIPAAFLEPQPQQVAA
jgi:hypothetical protein